MGSGGSVEEGSMLYVDEHGSIGLKSDYIESLLPEMDFDIKQPVVTKQHEAVIHKHWAIVCRGTSAFHKDKHLTPTKFFATTFYSNLFKAAPEVRPMFRSSMTVQGKALTGLVALLATVIKANNIVSACHDLARMHARYGATKAHYTSIGKVLIQTLEEVSGPEWSEEIRTAYLTSYCLLYYIMLPVILETPRRPLQLCLPGHVARKQALTSSSYRLTIAVDFPLRYHPGDSILLGLSMKEGEIRRSYAITSLYEAGMHTFDICVHAKSETSKWLCGVPTDTVINIYWINTGVHLETDTHTSIPRKLLFISENMGAAPLFTMTKGLHAIRDQHDGDIVFLQCYHEEPIPYFQSPIISAKPNEAWDRCRVTVSNNITREKLHEIAPDLPQRHLYVAGSPEMIDSTIKLFIELGGTAEHVTIYSFDNSTFLSN